MGIQFGHIPGYPEGSSFRRRAELQAAGLHSQNMAGISGTAKTGADAIVVSGGYIDDADYGDVIVYTGHGGRDQSSERQVRDQKITDWGNAALVRSQLEGFPVRVIRGRHKKKHQQSPYAPISGYRYDGLYRVEDHWSKLGVDGFRVWQFRLIKLQDDEISTPEDSSPKLTSQGANKPTQVVTSVIQRIVRNSMVAHIVKSWYSHKCQICGLAIEVTGGLYSEGAHIRALGKPHHGPDVPENVLCLCPNDHVRFDNGALYLTDDLRVIDALTGQAASQLHVHKDHNIDLRHVAYHRDHWSKN
ncbi:YDG/SRA domain-containing protein [Microbispora sp. CA-135349]|uniref:YDG/SRA domain-containing protein n=1 Tax=Microbispora sp. CA-135349 TaxID=3239953 RepID=UPI003D902568